MTKIPSIAVFGASGGTGLALVARIAARGWPARALVRKEGAAFVQSPRLDIRVGELLRPEDVSSLVKDSDAVCCVFGQRLPASEVFCAKATRLVLDAMRTHGVRRLICVTGAMVGDYPRNRSKACQWASRAVARRLPAVSADRVEQERLVWESGLEWTLVKPPRLTNGPRKGRVVAGPDRRVGLLSKISRSDLAEFILEEIGRPSFVRQAVFLAG